MTAESPKLEDDQAPTSSTNGGGTRGTDSEPDAALGNGASAAPAEGEQPNLLEKALEYADKGWYVHPLRREGKKPLTEHGFKDASRDEEAIRAWWDKWPDANIGIGRAHV